MLTDFLKRNRILLIFSALYVLTIALVLLELDKQYYQNAKRTIINADIQTFINKDLGEDKLRELEGLTLEALRGNDPKPLSQLKQKIWDILNGPSIVFRIAIRPELSGAYHPDRPRTARGSQEDLVNLPKMGKLRLYNNFSNSLFLKNFWGQISRPIVDGQGNAIARLVVFYTTPRNDSEIEELTTRYRWYSIFIVVILSLLASAMVRSLLFPLRNAMNSIEQSTPERTVFIARPHSRLENLYNRMALDAVIARLQGQLRDEITQHPQITSWEVVGFVCQAFREQVGMPLVACLELVAEGPGRIRATGQRIIVGQASWATEEGELVEQIEQLAPHDGRTEARFTLPELTPPAEGALRMIADPERTGIRYLFVLALDPRTNETAYVSLAHVLGRLVDLVEAGLQTLSLRNQLLVQERGRANISLSRNLGHDLTNIIATSKLELMALDRLLGGGTVPEDERRRQILLESLHGLLRSVKFMQETVNLYRAYAFLQHPILETQDGNQLVSETLDLFAMSISGKVELSKELAEDSPRCHVDQRLVKLALFNLFANALEAIRKCEQDRSVRGWIKVITRSSVEGGLCIAVEDSGTGIMNSAGQRAEAHEIEKIFELGYTSQRTSGTQGEGLGLNWVRTIVQDLHGGSIFAENMDEGGARFILIFPPLEAVRPQEPPPAASKPAELPLA